MSVVMQRQSSPTETVLSNKISRNRIVLSFKDSSRKPLRRRPEGAPRNWALAKSQLSHMSHKVFFARFGGSRGPKRRRTYFVTRDICSPGKSFTAGHKYEESNVAVTKHVFCVSDNLPTDRPKCMPQNNSRRRHGQHRGCRGRRGLNCGTWLQAVFGRPRTSLHPLM